MRDEPESDRLQFCHAPSASDDSDPEREYHVPDDTWCSLDTDTWWNFADHFPELAKRQIEAAGVTPSRPPGLACPIPDCGNHVGDPPPQPLRLTVIARSFES